MWSASWNVDCSEVECELTQQSLRNHNVPAAEFSHGRGEGGFVTGHQGITPFSPSRPARGCAVLANALRAALTAALRRAFRDVGNPPSTSDTAHDSVR
jgi:hypothetical protein